MSRKPRIHYPGAFYHVILRGNGGQDIFLSKKDRTKFYLLLQEGIERFEHHIHAFCLMTNHLVIQVGDIALSKIMQGHEFRVRLVYGHLAIWPVEKEFRFSISACQSSWSTWQ